MGTNTPHELLMLALHMQTLGHKWHKGAAQMPHHIHMQLPWPPIINIATPHQARRRTITETSTQLACSGLLREGSIQNITYFFPSLAREGTNLSYIFEGMAHVFLHMSTHKLAWNCSQMRILPPVGCGGNYPTAVRRTAYVAVNHNEFGGVINVPVLK